MTDSRVRVDRATDPERYLATDHTVWFGEVPSAPTEQQLLGIPEDQRFAADVDGSDPGTYPGIYGVFPMTPLVPGSVPGFSMDPRHVQGAGLTWVGVHPDHRRQGVLTAMMRHHFEQVREEGGTHVSALHASEPAIYGRHGYGLASLELEVTVGRGTGLTAPYLEDRAAAVTTQLATVSDPEVPERMRECHLATAELGSVVGAVGYYARVCSQWPEQLRDKESWRVLFARRGGGGVGFAMFLRPPQVEGGGPHGGGGGGALGGGSAARVAPP